MESSYTPFIYNDVIYKDSKFTRVISEIGHDITNSVFSGIVFNRATGATVATFSTTKDAPNFKFKYYLVFATCAALDVQICEYVVYETDAASEPQIMIAGKMEIKAKGSD